MSTSVYTYAADITAEDLLHWEFISQNPGIKVVDGLPLPPEKPNLTPSQPHVNKPNTIVVSGNAGPRMPAVAPGHVYKENILEKSSHPSLQPMGLNSYSAPSRYPERIVVPGIEAQKANSPNTASSLSEDKQNILPEFAKLVNIKKSVVMEFKNIIGAFDTAPSFKEEEAPFYSEGIPPEIQLPISSEKPYLSFVYEQGQQTELNPSQIFILKSEIQNIKNAQYQGQIKIFSYAESESFNNNDTRNAIMGRAGHIRNLLLESGIDMRQLDVRAVPNTTKDNRVDLFLTGKG